MKFRLDVLVVAAGGAMCLNAAALAQWSTDPALNNAVADGPTEQVLCKIAASPAGGSYISWFQNESGNYNVYMQHLDAAGAEVWPHGGVLVSSQPQSTSLVDYDLMADSFGGAVVVFTDTRDGGDLDVQAYRLDAEGNQVWGPLGINLSPGNSIYEADPKVTQNSAGDFVFAWPRLNGTAGGSGIVMQVVSPAGDAQLPAGGLLLPTGATGNENNGFCEIVPAGDDGSVIISWIRDMRTFQSLRHVRAQKFTASGKAVWNGGAPLIISGAISVPIAHHPRLISDGAGGAVSSWHDTRNGNRFDVWVQHIDASGALLFPANGLQASLTATQYHLDPAVAYNADTQEIFLAWNERNSAQSAWGIFAQKISADGQRLWGDGGAIIVDVNPVYKLFPRIITAGDGAEVFFLDQPNTPIPGERVLGSRLDASGAPVWAPEPSLIASTVSVKGRLPIARAADGGALLAWEDHREGTTDVFAQRVNTDGTLGPAPAPACSADWNHDDSVNSQDFFDFIGDFFAGNADFNATGSTDSQDFFDFITAFFAGC